MWQIIIVVAGVTYAGPIYHDPITCAGQAIDFVYAENLYEDTDEILCYNAQTNTDFLVKDWWEKSMKEDFEPVPMNKPEPKPKYDTLEAILGIMGALR